MEWLTALFESRGLPHGYCIAWDPRLLWAMVIGNGLVALAYFSIPFALGHFLRRQPNLPFGWMFTLFGAFIFFCGLTHVIDIINLWRPLYRLDAVVMTLTAGVSVATAICLLPLIPRASNYLDEVREQGQRLNEVNQQLQEATTALEQRNAALAISERRFRLTVEGAPIGLAIVGLDGRWIEVNLALCEMLGYSRSELLAKSFQDITHPDDLARDLAEVDALVQGRKSKYRMNKRYIRQDDSVISVQLDVALQRDAEGQPLHFISQIQDITERQKMLADLRASEAEARLMGVLDNGLQTCLKMEEIGPFVSRACLQLFPGCSGVVYLINASETHLESLYGWGDDTASEPVFSPEDCWGLRRGETWLSDAGDAQRVRCGHRGKVQREAHAGQSSLCLPLTGQGELIGMLFVQWTGDAASHGRAVEVAELVSARVGLALANLRLRETLRNQSIRDPLTGLYNRRHLEESLSRDFARAERDAAPIAVLMIDIDHFKRFNDEHGHTVGDIALRRVADEINAFCRRGDLASRYGGEEFTVVMTQITLAEATARAEALCAQIRRVRVETRAHSLLSVTISIGVAHYPTHGETPAQIVDAADRALYRAKRAGRNCVITAGAPGTGGVTGPVPDESAV